MIKDYEKYQRLIKKLESITKQLKALDVEDEQMEGQIELLVDDEVSNQVVNVSKTKIINDNFELCWKLIPSTQWDSKKRVTKDTKVRLYDYGYDLVKKACENYLDVQKVEYRYKRDKFFNEIIWNYLDMIEEENAKYKSNFDFGGFNGKKIS